MPLPMSDRSGLHSALSKRLARSFDMSFRSFIMPVLDAGHNDLMLLRDDAVKEAYGDQAAHDTIVKNAYHTHVENSFHVYPHYSDTAHFGAICMVTVEKDAGIIRPAVGEAGTFKFSYTTSFKITDEREGFPQTPNLRKMADVHHGVMSYYDVASCFFSAMVETCKSTKDLHVIAPDLVRALGKGHYLTETAPPTRSRINDTQGRFLAKFASSLSTMRIQLQARGIDTTDAWLKMVTSQINESLTATVSMANLIPEDDTTGSPKLPWTMSVTPHGLPGRNGYSLQRTKEASYVAFDKDLGFIAKPDGSHCLNEEYV